MGLLLGLCALWPGFGVRLAQSEPPAPKNSREYREQVSRVYEQAQERWCQDTNNVDVAWEFGRAAFDWAEFATNDHGRSAIAELGIAACRRAVALDSNSVAAHYYLGLNLGQLARTKILGALKLIDEMEIEWSRAIQLDPKFDFGGPHRSLGVLYRDAPGWPTSIGSERKSRLHLERALELHPEYPGNVLCLQEGQLEWGEKKSIREGIAATEDFFHKAQITFDREAWAWDWQDWDRRWSELKRKAGVKAD